MNKRKESTKKIFRKLGSCSHTFFYLVNIEFGTKMDIEGRATDPLAGGIYQQGYQCGMLWGTSLAIGAESFRRYGKNDKSIGVAIKATKQIMESFENRTDSIECYDITECNFTNKVSMAKYFISGKFLSCFTLAEKWAPEAIQSASKGLEENNNIPIKCSSCATEMAKRMGASDEEAIMVAGFAGGLGLSGSACGAFSAAIWLKNLERCRSKEKPSFHDPKSEERLEAFYDETNYEILCNKITGENFNKIEDHRDFINSGGCEKLINRLSEL